MDKKSKVLKYKVVNTNIDKKFIGKNLDLERVKTKGGPGNDRIPPKKQKSTRDLLIEFMGEQRAFNRQQLEFNKSIREDLNRVIKLNNLKY